MFTLNGELKAIAKAEQLARDTGLIHTVWFCWAALEASVSVGTLPPLHMSAQRLATVSPTETVRV